MIIIPIKWLFHWEYTLFSDKPVYKGYKGYKGYKAPGYKLLALCSPIELVHNLSPT